MPKAPKGQKRHADVSGAAVPIAKIATREIEEDLSEGEDGKDKAAVALGRRGGVARAKSTSRAQRKAIARKAALSRWHKKKT